MDKCAVDSCNESVSKKGHKFCYMHWELERDGEITACEKCGKYKDNAYPLCKACYSNKNNKKYESKGQTLSSTKIGDEFDLSGMKVNQILAELGWISKAVKGWELTPQGKAQGGKQKEVRNSGVPFVVWPESIFDNKSLIRTVKVYKGEKEDNGSSTIKTTEELSFREKFPATHRTQDGHMVRSRAEVIIDNFLYVARVVHAYERKVPIEEDLYCDFYLPAGKVYIEFWGLEEDERYRARKLAKLELYKKHDLSLLELKDKHILNLDDYLPKMLLKYKIACD